MVRFAPAHFMSQKVFLYSSVTVIMFFRQNQKKAHLFTVVILRLQPKYMKRAFWVLRAR